MTERLVRYQQTGDMHFLTFSCYHRLPYLASPKARNLFEDALERTRQKYSFVVAGYVVMPEHVHLLVNEPKRSSLDQAIKAIKLSVTLRRRERPFWQARYYDFNVFTEDKRVEKLRYIHRNPVVRGLVEKPEDWAWSSFRHYSAGVEGTVEIESFWTGWRREYGDIPSQVRESGPGAPGTLLPSRQEDVLLTELDSIACGSQLCSLPGAPSVAAKTDDLQFLCDSLAVSTAIFALLRRRTTAGSIRAFLWIIHKPPSCLCSEPFVPRTRTYDAKIKRKDCSRGAPFFRAFCEGVRDYETSHARSSFRDSFRGWGLRLNRCLSPHPKQEISLKTCWNVSGKSTSFSSPDTW